ncbi:MAG: transcription antitermination factor NusB [Bacteroidetes bacterium]|nr:transcription antitermination factor NusB [Rhodothermia bacterium]MCS7154952.1 transcription antitermination factor NusB [Bacteroidota bacterium]MCX7907236.1 transcription antitermination factor NusB [Bacteroidota bacterium]MDW8138038.1 transcription antitermination factor NusB [Bacteroidota bacterium]MDW8286110.1 transcription antitermination factor NusB [Bacteroidota bacterium]
MPELLDRHALRELVLQALYAYEVGRQDPVYVYQDLIASRLQHDPIGLEFAQRLYRRVLEHLEVLDRYISRHATNWDLERIAVIDRVALRMAIAELLYFEDIPPKVSLDEAIELVKRFSTEESHRFVNGVLDSILEELRTTGQLRKTGRGLIETSPE